MVRLSARLQQGQFDAPFSDFYRGAVQRLENAALIATNKAAGQAKQAIRTQMQAARLGRLGNAIDANSDLSRGVGVKRRGEVGFSASGAVFIRSRSARTRGAIESYTQGADILPRRGRWLWIASDQIPRVTGRYRMTPELYRLNGFERKIGPLVQVKGKNGYPLLIVRNVGVSEAGKSRSAKSLTKRGLARKGQVRTEFIVAFIGIPRTSRAARVDVAAIMQQIQAQLPDLFKEALGRI